MFIVSRALEDDFILGGLRVSQRQPEIQLLCLLGRIAGGQDLEAEVACSGRRAGRLVLGNLAECHVGKDPRIFRAAQQIKNSRLPFITILLKGRFKKKSAMQVFLTDQGSVPIRPPAPLGLLLWQGPGILETDRTWTPSRRSDSLPLPTESQPEPLTTSYSHLCKTQGNESFHLHKALT